MALPMVGWAAMYEEANRSIFGPVVLQLRRARRRQHELLALVGTPAQKEKWLRPIVEGRVRSAFAMTEPAPGGGSDPGMIRTRAEKKGDRGSSTATNGSSPAQVQPRISSCARARPTTRAAG